MSKVVKKPIVIKKKQEPVEPEASEESEVEIEFDEESPAVEYAKELDQRLLASRTADPLDSDTEEKKEIIGSRAKLRALMNKVEDEESSEEAQKKAPKKVIKAKKSTKTVIKKGPGRPRKTPKKEPIPRKGISKTPQNADSFIEVLYDQPLVMKKIFSFFRAIAAAQIQILFRPREIIFYALDHHEKTKIRVKIDASKLNHYYCRDVLDIGIDTNEMDMILNKVDKDYTSMVILSDLTNSRRVLTVVFETEIRIDEMHNLSLIGTYNKMENEEEFLNDEYTLSYELPAKYFKKTVSDIKNMSTRLGITQEDNESPLVFEYLTANKRVQSKHTVRDSNKIKLNSTLDDGETFRVDICIGYIKPISSSQIADEITICVDENKPFMTKAYIDNGTIEIKTLTEIIDDRPDEDDD